MLYRYIYGMIEQVGTKSVIGIMNFWGKQEVFNEI